jgi:hypothetical protein
VLHFGAADERVRVGAHPVAFRFEPGVRQHRVRLRLAQDRVVLPPMLAARLLPVVRGPVLGGWLGQVLQQLVDAEHRPARDGVLTWSNRSFRWSSNGSSNAGLLFEGRDMLTTHRLAKPHLSHQLSQ